MKAIFDLCIVGLCASVAPWLAETLVKVWSTVNIAPTPEGFQSAVGPVPGVRRCGGTANITDWRYESCTDSVNSTLCRIPCDGKERKSELSFIPSEPILGGLGIRFNITADGVPLKTYDHFIPASAAIPVGRVHTVRLVGSPPKELQGKLMRFQYILFRQVDNSVVACAEADFQNV